MNTISKPLKYFSVITLLAMLLVILGGSLVTKTGSGQGCGKTWPLCDSSEATMMETFFELSHRVVSGLTGLLVLILAIWTWRKLKHIQETKFLSITSFLFIVIQGLIGAAQVVWGQGKFILALHFGISLISFASVALLTLLVFEIDRKFKPSQMTLSRSLGFQFIGVTIYSYFVIYTGALVRHTQSTLACSDFPFCNNQNITSNILSNLQISVQMGHRIAAIILLIWIILITIKIFKELKDQLVLKYIWLIATGLIVLQALSGILIVYSNANMFFAISHGLIISLFFTTLCYNLMIYFRSKRFAS